MSTAKTMGISFLIAITLIAVITGAILGIDSISRKKTENEEANAKYNATYQSFLDGHYSTVVNDINAFKQGSYKDKDLSKKYDDLYQQTETKITNSIFNSTDNEEIESLCITYIDCFPNGNRIAEVNKKYVDTTNTLAPIRIKNAKQKISDKEYLEADRILNGIISNDKISKQYLNEAQTIKDSIAEIVKYETPISASMQDLLSNATYYNMRKINLTTDVIVTSVDRERKMLTVCPVSDSSYSGYDYSFRMEIYYGNMSNQTKWGSISPNDGKKLTYVSGRFKIYANRNNSGYIEADSIL